MNKPSIRIVPTRKGYVLMFRKECLSGPWKTMFDALEAKKERIVHRGSHE